MTLILKLDLDMVKMYLYAKNEVSMPRGSKVIVGGNEVHSDFRITPRCHPKHTREISVTHK